jgi:hypothetical protein
MFRAFCSTLRRDFFESQVVLEFQFFNARGSSGIRAIC